MNAKPFIPTWLDDAGLSQAEFRLYCHLCRRADNRTGIAWPDADSIAVACKMARNTVWASLRRLEERGLIERLPKPFADSNRYKIHTLAIGANGTPIEGLPISANGIPIEGLPISANGIPIEGLPIGANQSHQSAQMDSHQSAQMDSRKGSPKKVLQGRFSNNTLVEAIWAMTPARGKERSSKRELSAALKKAKHLPPQDEIIRSLEAWKKSESWTKDNGQFIPGIHRWVKDEKWETAPAWTGHPTLNHGGRKPRAIMADPANMPEGGEIEAVVALYPKRERQAEAFEALADHVWKGTDLDAVRTGTQAIAAVIARLPGAHLNSYIPSAAAFFRNRRWEDDPQTWLRNAGKHVNGAPPQKLDLGGRRPASHTIIES